MKSCEEPLLGNRQETESEDEFIAKVAMEEWTETQVLHFLNKLRLPFALYPELFNGKQLKQLASKANEQTLRKKVQQAKMYNDKMFEPFEASNRLIAAIRILNNEGHSAFQQALRKGFHNTQTEIETETETNDYKILINDTQNLGQGQTQLTSNGLEISPANSVGFTDQPAQKATDSVGLSDEEYEKAAFPRLFERPGWFAMGVIVAVGFGILLCLFALPERLKHDDQTVEEFRITVLKYASIPITMVPFTYFHIWLALWMTFYPVFFVGCWRIPGTNVGFPFGWQGIVPFKSVKMAKMAVDMITTKLITVEEVFLQLDPDKCAEILEPHIAVQMKDILEQVLTEEAPRLWGALPRAVKQKIVDDAAKDAPNVVKNLLGDLRGCIADCFDLEKMVIKVLLGDMEMCNDIFIKVSHKELAFIRNAGAWMGGIFGTAQMILWIYFRDWWVLPVLGFIVGAGTNWLALLFIFRPIEPIYLFNRWKIQGLFLQRQAQVSSLYARNISSKVMTPENLNKTLMTGPNSQVVKDLASKRVDESFEKSIALLRTPPIKIALKSVPQVEGLISRVKDKVNTKICDDLYGVMRNLEPYMGEAFDLNNTLRDRMSALPFADFEGLMHPIFKEDEPKLILMGGVLGVALGLLQMRMF